MRFIIGIIIGAALTIGAAYVHDQRAYGGAETPIQPPAAVADGQIVNWEVLGAVAHRQLTLARHKFNQFVGE
jgi:hypothetical protein